jgi:DNA repair exonuclease SbcCD ATPase subunit
MIVLKNITLRNFLSIGQVTQAVNFDSKELTLILGENLDLGGDGARNGTGKTTLIHLEPQSTTFVKII